MGWVKWIPFASIDPIHPRTNLDNCSAFGGGWKTQFFWVGHFDFFFWFWFWFFCFIPIKISPNLYGRMDGSKFWCFPWFPENSLLCVILSYTVYIVCAGKQKRIERFHTCNFTTYELWSTKTWEIFQQWEIKLKPFDVLLSIGTLVNWHCHLE